MIHCINISPCLSKKQKCFSKEKTVLRSVCVQNLHPAQLVMEQDLDFLEKRKRLAPMCRGMVEYGISDHNLAASPGH